ncbi:MAG: hypothetical protein HWE27_12030 [Gammaproteobacteria bacterium]|nr:hypothetical protein [Gammaproteobacteria bacterium]
MKTVSIFIMTLLQLFYSSSLFSRDVLECVHIDVPTSRFEVLGPLLDMGDNCGMYHHLLKNNIHGQKSNFHSPNNLTISEVLAPTIKVHDPDVCLIEIRLRGVEE